VCSIKLLPFIVLRRLPSPHIFEYWKNWKNRKNWKNWKNWKKWKKHAHTYRHTYKPKKLAQTLYAEMHGRTLRTTDRTRAPKKVLHGLLAWR